jgi:hypothetical protein
MSPRPIDRRRLATWAGSVGPALFVATFTIEGWHRPGYDERSMFISALALGPRGWIQSLNFVVIGVLFILFTRGIAAEFREGKASRAGPALLTISGVSFLASGPLVMDPASTPRDQMSLHGTLHGVFGALVFSLSPASCFVFLRRFRGDPRWRWLHPWTLAAAAIIVAAVGTQVVATKPPFAPNWLSAWGGLIQRAALITYLAWVFAFSVGLRSRGRPSA